jgi:AcrR family transcriptional regulator
MDLVTRHPGGRPRSFDRDAALEVAMRLFWRHGYEGVSFQQLTAATGLAAPSLYAAFGNKASLYREALDRYGTMRLASDLSFMDERLTLVDAVRLLLESTAKGLLDPAGEVGCMLNMGMITNHPDHVDLARELVERRAAFRHLLVEKLHCWVDGERAESLARYLTTVMQGMAIQAKDGATADELQAIADDALGVSWP